MRDVDEEFLTHLNSWRLKLAKNIYKNNKGKELDLNGRTIKLSFSSYIESKRSLEIIKESTQRILDRLLIIRFAEDKAIINPDQLLAINIAWEKSGKIISIKNLLNKFFLKFNIIYGSKIFEKGHICEKLEIDNGILSEIITEYNKHCFLKFNSNILGSTYESYLGHNLILKNNEIKLQLNQDIQKAGGIYYTPSYIIKFILQNTIELRLKEILDTCQKLSENAKYDKILKIILRLRKIKVLDPSCGSGSFLISTYNLMKDYFIQINNLTKGCIENSIERQIIKDNIFGVDLDPQAAEIATANLMLQAIKKGEKFPLILTDNIKIGNSIISGHELIKKSLFDQNNKEILPFEWENDFYKILSNEKFTYIVGNPPYIAWNKIPNRKLLENGEYLDLKYDCRPNHEDAQPNIYLFFLVRAINLMKNGRIGFIIPQEWRFENYAKKFRNYLLKKCNSIQIIRFNPQFKVFKNIDRTTGKNIGTNSLIIFLDLAKKKESNQKLVEYYIDDLEENKVISYLADMDTLENNSIKITKNFNDLINIPWIFSLPQEEKLKTKIESLSNTVSLANIDYFKVKGGFQPPINAIQNYQITADIFQTLQDKEKKYVFPAIFNASEMQRYFLNRKDKYWIILNEIDNKNELKRKFPALYEILSKSLNDNLSEWWKFPNIRNFDLIKNNDIKLLSPRTASRNSFSIDDKKSVFKGTNSMIISLQIDPYYLIGILNSSLANFWYSKFGFEYHGEKTKKYEPQKVREYSIPIIKPPTPEIEKKLNALVKNFIYIKKNGIKKLKTTKFKNTVDLESELQKIDDQIDNLVFNLYNLSPDEIEFVKLNGR